MFLSLFLKGFELLIVADFLMDISVSLAAHKRRADVVDGMRDGMVMMEITVMEMVTLIRILASVFDTFPELSSDFSFFFEPFFKR